jgi:hypothetical protein
VSHDGTEVGDLHALLDDEAGRGIDEVELADEDVVAQAQAGLTFDAGAGRDA